MRPRKSIGTPAPEGALIPGGALEPVGALAPGGGLIPEGASVASAAAAGVRAAEQDGAAVAGAQSPAFLWVETPRAAGASVGPIWRDLSSVIRSPPPPSTPAAALPTGTEIGAVAATTNPNPAPAPRLFWSWLYLSQPASPPTGPFWSQHAALAHGAPLVKMSAAGRAAPPSGIRRVL
eukprot:scaffold13221_cov100-Isochrysis_galbana.AAC.5